MTKGPIKSRDYWESKFNADQFGAGDSRIVSRRGNRAAAYLGDFNWWMVLLKTYPNHEELKKWHDRFTQVQKQIGDNFDRSAEFKPGCLWNSDTYMQTYVGYNTAKNGGWRITIRNWLS